MAGVTKYSPIDNASNPAFQKANALMQALFNGEGEHTVSGNSIKSHGVYGNFTDSGMSARVERAATWALVDSEGVYLTDETSKSAQKSKLADDKVTYAGVIGENLPGWFRDIGKNEWFQDWLKEEGTAAKLEKYGLSIEELRSPDFGIDFSSASDELARAEEEKQIGDDILREFNNRVLGKSQITPGKATDTSDGLAFGMQVLVDEYFVKAGVAEVHPSFQAQTLDIGFFKGPGGAIWALDNAARKLEYKEEHGTTKGYVPTPHPGPGNCAGFYDDPAYNPKRTEYTSAIDGSKLGKLTVEQAAAQRAYYVPEPGKPALPEGLDERVTALISTDGKFDPVKAAAFDKELGGFYKENIDYYYDFYDRVAQAHPNGRGNPFYESKVDGERVVVAWGKDGAGVRQVKYGAGFDRRINKNIDSDNVAAGAAEKVAIDYGIVNLVSEVGAKEYIKPGQSKDSVLELREALAGLGYDVHKTGAAAKVYDAELATVMAGIEGADDPAHPEKQVFGGGGLKALIKNLEDNVKANPEAAKEKKADESAKTPAEKSADKPAEKDKAADKGRTATDGSTYFMVMRHAEKVKSFSDNKGDSTGSLTSDGVEQAEAAVSTVKAIDPDVIYVSSSPRSRATILPYLKETGRTAVILPELSESTHKTGVTERIGDEKLPQDEKIELSAEEAKYFTFMSQEEYDSLAGYEGHDPQKNYDYGSGEVGSNKVFMAHERLVQKHGDSGEKVLIVSHGGSGSSLRDVLQGKAVTASGLPEADIQLLEQKPGAKNFALISDIKDTEIVAVVNQNGAGGAAEGKEPETAKTFADLQAQIAKGKEGYIRPGDKSDLVPVLREELAKLYVDDPRVAKTGDAAKVYDAQLATVMASIEGADDPAHPEKQTLGKGGMKALETALANPEAYRAALQEQKENGGMPVVTKQAGMNPKSSSGAEYSTYKTYFKPQAEDIHNAVEKEFARIRTEAGKTMYKVDENGEIVTSDGKPFNEGGKPVVDPDKQGKKVMVIVVGHDSKQDPDSYTYKGYNGAAADKAAFNIAMEQGAMGTLPGYTEEWLTREDETQIKGIMSETIYNTEVAGQMQKMYADMGYAVVIEKRADGQHRSRANRHPKDDTHPCHSVHSEISNALDGYGAEKEDVLVQELHYDWRGGGERGPLFITAGDEAYKQGSIDAAEEFRAGMYSFDALKPASGRGTDNPVAEKDTNLYEWIANQAAIKSTGKKDAVSELGNITVGHHRGAAQTARYNYVLLEPEAGNSAAGAKFLVDNQDTLAQAYVQGGVTAEQRLTLQKEKGRELTEAELAQNRATAATQVTAVAKQQEQDKKEDKPAGKKDIATDYDPSKFDRIPDDAEKGSGVDGVASSKAGMQPDGALFPGKTQQPAQPVANIGEAYAKLKEQGIERVVFYGDSHALLTHDYNAAELKKAGFETANLGNSGAGLRNGGNNGKGLKDVESIQEGDLVYISIGANDGGMMKSDEIGGSYRDDFRSLIQSVKDQGGVPVVVGMPEPNGKYTAKLSDKAGWMAKYDKVHEVEKEIAAEMGVQFHDYTDLTQEQAPRAADGLHMKFGGGVNTYGDALLKPTLMAYAGSLGQQQEQTRAPAKSFTSTETEQKLPVVHTISDPNGKTWGEAAKIMADIKAGNSKHSDMIDHLVSQAQSGDVYQQELAYADPDGNGVMTSISVRAIPTFGDDGKVADVHLYPVLSGGAVHSTNKTTYKEDGKIYNTEMPYNEYGTGAHIEHTRFSQNADSLRLGFPREREEGNQKIFTVDLSEPSDALDGMDKMGDGRDNVATHARMIAEGSNACGVHHEEHEKDMLKLYEGVVEHGASKGQLASTEGSEVGGKGYKKMEDQFRPKDGKAPYAKLHVLPSAQRHQDLALAEITRANEAAAALAANTQPKPAPETKTEPKTEDVASTTNLGLPENYTYQAVRLFEAGEIDGKEAEVEDKMASANKVEVLGLAVETLAIAEQELGKEAATKYFEDLKEPVHGGIRGLSAKDYNQQHKIAADVTDGMIADIAAHRKEKGDARSVAEISKDVRTEVAANMGVQTADAPKGEYHLNKDGSQFRVFETARQGNTETSPARVNRAVQSFAKGVAEEGALQGVIASGEDRNAIKYTSDSPSVMLRQHAMHALVNGDGMANVAEQGVIGGKQNATSATRGAVSIVEKDGEFFAVTYDVEGSKTALYTGDKWKEEAGVIQQFAANLPARETTPDGTKLAQTDTKAKPAPEPKTEPAKNDFSKEAKQLEQTLGYIDGQAAQYEAVMSGDDPEAKAAYIGKTEELNAQLKKFVKDNADNLPEIVAKAGKAGEETAAAKLIEIAESEKVDPVEILNSAISEIDNFVAREETLLAQAGAELVAPPSEQTGEKAADPAEKSKPTDAEEKTATDKKVKPADTAKLAEAAAEAKEALAEAKLAAKTAAAESETAEKLATEAQATAKAAQAALAAEVKAAEVALAEEMKAAETVAEKLAAEVKVAEQNQTKAAELTKAAEAAVKAADEKIATAEDLSKAADVAAKSLATAETAVEMAQEKLATAEKTAEEVVAGEKEAQAAQTEILAGLTEGKATAEQGKVQADKSLKQAQAEAKTAATKLAEASELTEEAKAAAQKLTIAERTLSEAEAKLKTAEKVAETTIVQTAEKQAELVAELTAETVVTQQSQAIAKEMLNAAETDAKAADKQMAAAEKTAAAAQKATEKLADAEKAVEGSEAKLETVDKASDAAEKKLVEAQQAVKTAKATVAELAKQDKPKPDAKAPDNESAKLAEAFQAAAQELAQKNVPILSKGVHDRNPDLVVDVRKYQGQLESFKINTGNTYSLPSGEIMGDGDYGRMSDRGTKVLQEAHGLVVDGDRGGATQMAVLIAEKTNWKVGDPVAQEVQTELKKYEKSSKEERKSFDFTSLASSVSGVSKEMFAAQRDASDEDLEKAKAAVEEANTVLAKAKDSSEGAATKKTEAEKEVADAKTESAAIAKEVAEIQAKAKTVVADAKEAKTAAEAKVAEAKEAIDTANANAAEAMAALKSATPEEGMKPEETIAKAKAAVEEAKAVLEDAQSNKAAVEKEVADIQAKAEAEIADAKEVKAAADAKVEDAKGSLEIANTELAKAAEELKAATPKEGMDKATEGEAKEAVSKQVEQAKAELAKAEAARDAASEAAIDAQAKATSLMATAKSEKTEATEKVKAAEAATKTADKESARIAEAVKAANPEGGMADSAKPAAESEASKAAKQTAALAEEATKNAQAKATAATAAQEQVKLAEANVTKTGAKLTNANTAAEASAKEAEEAKMAEAKAKEAEEAKQAEAKAKEAEEAKQAEAKAKEAEEAKQAEAKAKEAEEAKQAEAKAKEAEEAKQAEAKAKEAEEAKQAEAKAKEAEEAKQAEAKAKEAEEAKQAEAKAKEAEEAKTAEAKAKEAAEEKEDKPPLTVEEKKVAIREEFQKYEGSVVTYRDNGSVRTRKGTEDAEEFYKQQVTNAGFKNATEFQKAVKTTLEEKGLKGFGVDGDFGSQAHTGLLNLALAKAENPDLDFSKGIPVEALAHADIPRTIPKEVAEAADKAVKPEVVEPSAPRPSFVGRPKVSYTPYEGDDALFIMNKVMEGAPSRAGYTDMVGYDTFGNGITGFPDDDGDEKTYKIKTKGGKSTHNLEELLLRNPTYAKQGDKVVLAADRSVVIAEPSAEEVTEGYGKYSYTWPAGTMSLTDEGLDSTLETMISYKRGMTRDMMGEKAFDAAQPHEQLWAQELGYNIDTTKLFRNNAIKKAFQEGEYPKDILFDKYTLGGVNGLENRRWVTTLLSAGDTEAAAHHFLAWKGDDVEKAGYTAEQVVAAFNEYAPRNPNQTLLMKPLEGPSLAEGDSGPRTLVLQVRLRETGAYNGPINGIYTAEVGDAVENLSKAAYGQDYDDGPRVFGNDAMYAMRAARAYDGDLQHPEFQMVAGAYMAKDSEAGELLLAAESGELSARLQQRVQEASQQVSSYAYNSIPDKDAANALAAEIHASTAQAYKDSGRTARNSILQGSRDPDNAAKVNLTPSDKVRMEAIATGVMASPVLFVERKGKHNEREMERIGGEGGSQYVIGNTQGKEYVDVFLTDGYGKRDTQSGGTLGSVEGRHGAADTRAMKGDPVYARHGAVVYHISENGNGTSSISCFVPETRAIFVSNHTDPKNSLEVGDVVKAGDKIGNVAGDHLDTQVYYATEGGALVNISPMSTIDTQVLAVAFKEEPGRNEGHYYVKDGETVSDFQLTMSENAALVNGTFLSQAEYADLIGSSPSAIAMGISGNRDGAMRMVAEANAAKDKTLMESTVGVFTGIFKKVGEVFDKDDKVHPAVPVAGETSIVATPVVDKLDAGQLAAASNFGRQVQERVAAYNESTGERWTPDQVAQISANVTTQLAMENVSVLRAIPVERKDLAHACDAACDELAHTLLKGDPRLSDLIAKPEAYASAVKRGEKGLTEEEVKVFQAISSEIKTELLKTAAEDGKDKEKTADNNELKADKLVAVANEMKTAETPEEAAEKTAAGVDPKSGLAPKAGDHSVA